MSSRGAPHIPTKKRSRGGSFVTRVPCNPETRVGLQAALVEPASEHLHVAEPVRHGARGITLQAMTTLSLLCKLCDCCMEDRSIYMYMSMGFCTEECRDEYFLDHNYRLAKAMEAEGRRTTSEARKASVVEEEEAIGNRRIFFICAEVESFPEA